MTSLALGAAQRTTQIISRQKELDKLELAVCAPGNETRVIVIRSDGGIGKSRLLEELLKIAGHPDYSTPASLRKWDMNQVIVSEILDFSPIDDCPGNLRREPINQVAEIVGLQN